jgi:hypothetical protein
MSFQPIIPFEMSFQSIIPFEIYIQIKATRSQKNVIC